MNKKSITSIISTLLIIIITIIFLFQFQLWYNNYSSKNQVKIEKLETNQIFLKLYSNNSLYLVSNSETEIIYLKINDNTGKEICSFGDLNFNDHRNLVGWWTFDEGEGNITYDKSKNKLNGIISKTNLWSLDSISGYSLIFNGLNSRDYVDLGNNEKLNPEEFTITAWIKLKQINYSYNYIYSNSRDCCGNYNGIDLRVGSTNRLNGKLWNQSLTTTNIINKKIIVDEWNFIAYSFNGTHHITYTGSENINILQSPMDTIGQPASYNSYIGAMGYFPNIYSLNGTIDEFRLYNKSLSKEEIKQIYLYPEKKIKKGVNIINFKNCSLKKNSKYNLVGFSDEKQIDFSFIAK